MHAASNLPLRASRAGRPRSILSSSLGLRRPLDRRGRPRRPPILEQLEARTLLSSVTYTVDSTADNGSSGTLRWSITQANTVTPKDTNTINFNLPGGSTITLESALPALGAGHIAIKGPGAANLTVEPDPAHRNSDQFGIFVVDGGATAAFSGLTIADGEAELGGDIDNGGTATVTDCTISGGSASLGGGVYNGGTMTLADCTVSGNSATFGGGIDDAVNSGGQLTLTDCTVSGNAGGGIGDGGLAIGGTVTLTDCTVSGNSGGGIGIGGFESGGSVTLTDSVVSSNSGDGIFNDGGTTSLTGCNVSNNSGDGISGDGGTATLANCTVSRNSGGIVNDDCSTTASDCTV
jgi:Right handed beta helix region